MFSSYSYNTLKYLGCDPEQFPNKLSKVEYDFLVNNLQRMSILRHSGNTFIFMGGSHCFIPRENTPPVDNWSKEFMVEANYWNMQNHKLKVIDKNLSLEYEGDSPLETLVTSKLNKLKKLVKRNHGIVLGDKRLRANWVFAYIKTVLYGFNVFALSGLVQDDMLYEIRKYL